VALAERGVAVEAVEPDPRMAALARTRCAGLPVRIRETRFEDWQGAAGTFDLVVCAQAWHWLDHARACAVAATALRRDGALAVWWTRPRAVHGRVLEAVRDAYRRLAPALGSQTSLLVMRPAADIPDRAPGFGAWRTESHPWQQAFDSRSYAALISTQPDHRLLPVEHRTPLIDAVTHAIEAHGNRIEYEFRTDLSVAEPRKIP
jgi:SAM-dependent methyltransferase